MATSQVHPVIYFRQYPHSARSVGPARREVVEFARSCGFSGQALNDIEAAVGEGLANAVEHGCPQQASFELSFYRDLGTLSVEIKDSGRGFDHHTVFLREKPGSEAARGFGTMIMRELMDEVHYSDYGTRLRLLKRLPD